MLISVANSREGRAQLSRRIHPFIDWLSPHIEMGGEGGGGKGGEGKERERERERINISFACLWRGNWVAF